MRVRLVLACAGLATLAAPSALAQVVINEIRIDQPGTDVDEFFELAGPPGTSLTGLTYLVLGDSSTLGSGVIEEVVDLSGSVIPPSGFFVAAEPTFTLGTADLTATLDFENGDNVTHLLVSGFTGPLPSNDLDTNDDGVLDVTPWTAVLDRVAVILENNPPTGTEYHYGPPTVGPDVGFAPGAVYRGPDGTGTFSSWNVGDFADLTLTDTPGSPNANGGILVGTGGVQTLVVDVGAAYAGDLYVVGTNFTGTAPGTSIGGVLVPLNIDALVLVCLENANSSIFANTFGTLDASGRAFAALNLPPLPPIAAGLALNSAALVLDAATGVPALATNPVPLDLFP
ncbi:MAG TPA: hypothetical protein VFI25_03940 [Planctomycetota bacterium]|jgi:hypothetical protein|nr:hypothetical protein [Planctomycetota bacterium]